VVATAARRTLKALGRSFRIEKLGRRRRSLAPKAPDPAGSSKLTQVRQGLPPRVREGGVEKNLAGSGCRCCAVSSGRDLQRFPRTLERCRPRHPHSEASQGRERDAAVATGRRKQILPQSVTVHRKRQFHSCSGWLTSVVIYRRADCVITSGLPILEPWLLQPPTARMISNSKSIGLGRPPE
jgi:hypothetical protein